MTKVAFVTGGSGFLGRNLIPYLIQRGCLVRALGRSEEARAKVRALGAEPVDGDLSGGPGVEQALHGAEVVFHCAAWAEEWGDPRVAWEANVEGTQRMLDAARAAAVPRFVHVSTEAVLVDGTPIVRADETRPLPAKPIGLYARTKGEAERRVRAAAGAGYGATIVRPRFIWGRGDSNLLPKIIDAARRGILQWMDGGRYLTSTCHVDNVCEGMLLAADRGRPGEAYFLTDGEPVVFRDFITRMLETQGVPAPTREVPRWLVHAVAAAGDALWRWLHLPGRPPLPHMSFHLMGEEVTVVDAKARRELGYQGKVTVEQGLLAMRP